MSARAYVRKVQNVKHVFVKLAVANPFNVKKRVKVEFLIDTGASITAINSDLAKKLELEPAGYVELELVDGSKTKADIVRLMIEVDNRVVFTDAACGENFDIILGMDVMELLGLNIDTLTKRAFVPIKSFKVVKMSVKTNLKPENLHGGGRGVGS